MNQSGIYKSKEEIKIKDTGLQFNLRTSRMLNEEMMYKYLKRKLKFPAYFGYNLDALFDCLTDLSWFEDKNQFILIFDKAEMLLSQENKSKAKEFRQLLNDVVDEWKENEIEFIVILPE